MKSIKYGLATALLTGALSTPALADVDLKVLVFVHKDVDIEEYIFIYKELDFEAEVHLYLENDAEAYSYANVLNIANVVVGGGGGHTRADDIDGSIVGNVGGVQVNQDSGNMVNQANLLTYGLTGDGDAVTTAETSVDQFNTDNFVLWIPGNINVSATINNSITDNDGVVGVNQNAGNMNNQTNAAAIALGINAGEDEEGDGMVALAEADLGQFNAFNTVFELDSMKSASITSSINNNSGVTHVNQAIGNNSNQANLVSVSATLR